MLLLCFRFALALDLGRALPNKTCVFFCQVRALDCCRFQVSGNKKIQLCLFLLVFYVALINFFLNRSKGVFSAIPH